VPVLLHQHIVTSTASVCLCRFCAIQKSFLVLIIKPPHNNFLAAFINNFSNDIPYGKLARMTVYCCVSVAGIEYVARASQRVTWSD
jgi:hypothetical protein